MNFQQLRIFRETLRRDFNLTDAANALFTSQSGVSKHLKDLEAELGVELFVRRGRRLLGLTGPGRDMVPTVLRMLHDAENLKRIAERYADRDRGTLTVATTHSQARYTLPPIVAAFRREFPGVELALHESSPEQIVRMLNEGQADLGIATEAVSGQPEIACFPYYRWHHSVIVPIGHPLERVADLTIEALAAQPLITYREGFTGRARIDAAFAAADLVPRIVLTAMDAEVIKTYVATGLGVGVLASVALAAGGDPGLTTIACPQLFADNTVWIAIPKGQLMRGFGYRFIELCAPDLSAEQIRAATLEPFD